ncbi:MAG: Hint domain-containing protein, partial [Thermoflexales bacterium]|nr:Hint domain-containing protein [Thermoflexales bacterium]
MREVFGVEAKKDTDNRLHNNNSVRLNFYSKPVAQFFRGQFYTPEGQKTLPSWVLELPNDRLAALVSGYWLSDGSETGQEYRALTVSPQLAGQLKMILQRLGIAARGFYENKGRQSIVNGKVVRSTHRFHLMVGGKSAQRLAHALGEKRASMSSNRQRGFWADGGYWLPIQSVEVQPYEGLVYNLETEDHSYTTAQGCVHNCDNVPYADLSDFFYCLTPDTLVLTEEGYVPIERVQVGMRVLSHRGRWVRVQAVSQRRYEGHLYAVRVAYCSLPLRITPGHEVLVWRRGASCAEWIPVEWLQVGDRLLLPHYRPASSPTEVALSDTLTKAYPTDGEWLYYGRVSDRTLLVHRALAGCVETPRGTLAMLARQPNVSYRQVVRLRWQGQPDKLRVPNRVPVDGAFARLVGYYLAEGSVTLRSNGRHVLSFSFHIEEEALLSDVEQQMAQLFGLRGRRALRPSERAAYLLYYSKPVAEFFAETFGRDSAHKRLPAWFLDLPEALLEEFVRGFWRGDGSVGDEFCQLTTTSPYLAGQLRLILQRLGIAAHLYWDTKERTAQCGNKLVRARPRFLLKVWGKHRQRLKELLGVPVSPLREGKYLIEWSEAGLWVPIREIRTVPYEGFVYNLQTEDHSYTTAQGCVHNCWLKRTIGHLYPELFATPLTPKSEELVADASKRGGMEQALRWFYEGLAQSFREIRRVLKPDGIAVIVFAHKTTEAWEAVINALLEAGLYMTASWPIHTEMQARLRAQESAALASSIYMVCRKRPPDAPVGEYNTVRREIEARVQQKLAQFWDAGIRGADFFMSAIGPAVEAFGKYACVEKRSGEQVTIAELLEYVRKVVAEFALGRILHTAQLGGVDALTRFYLLWRWTYNHARVPFDEARKLAAGVGVELSQHWLPGGLVQKDKEHIRVLSPQDRAKDARFERKEQFDTMVDALHRACVLWEENRQSELREHLAKTFGANEVFWQIAQAISEVLPNHDKEKQVLQGLLYGRERITSRIANEQGSDQQQLRLLREDE